MPSTGETTTSSASPSTSAGAGRISQLKPPGNLDFEISSELPHAWKKWKEEVTLYMDLAMEGRDEQTKVKLFLNIIGSQGREIYDTLTFARPPGERSLKDVIDAFEAHCNPKRNETVDINSFQEYKKRENLWGAGLAQCQSTRLPPMWPGFDSRTRRLKWAEFVGSLLCSERFFSENANIVADNMNVEIAQHMVWNAKSATSRIISPQYACHESKHKCTWSKAEMKVAAIMMKSK